MKIVNIAAVVSGLDEEYPYNIIQGINRCAAEKDMNVTYFAAFGGVVNSRRFDRGEYSIFDLVDFSRFDGAILLTNTFGDIAIRGKIIEKVRAAGIPAVVLECGDDDGFYDIRIDNYSVMKELVEHVIVKHGCKVINYVSGPMTNPEAKERYSAFESAMKEHGLRIEEERVFFGNFRSVDGVLAIDDFERSGRPLPDAFICANDSMALSVISSLERLGYSVPDDVIVTGFDNTFNARNCAPALTTVSRPLFFSGYRACRIVRALINGVRQPKSTLLDASPVYTESCGCPRSSEEDLQQFKKNAYRRIERNTSDVHMLNHLTAALAETETEEECFDVLAGMLRELECERFSLCLVPDRDGEDSREQQGEYSRYMTAPLIWDKGQRRSVSSFESRQMFPEPLRTGGNISYFLPLHFGEKTIGYCIMTNTDFPINSILCHTFSMTIGNALENISKLEHIRKAMEELNGLYVIDPLCGIYNRNGFMNLAGDSFAECAAESRPVMVSFIDMDGLKTINDSLGHRAGDSALKRLAAAIRDCCGSGSICARVGGDEFIIFTMNAEATAPAELQRRFEEELVKANRASDSRYSLSASMGSVLLVPKEGDRLADIIEQADEKMYEIKKRRKARRI